MHVARHHSERFFLTPFAPPKLSDGTVISGVDSQMESSQAAYGNHLSG
jgi:hypothetical protein